MTAGQMALGGRRPVDTARVDVAYADIRECLTKGWTDWVVTGNELRRVHEQLEKLPPMEYRQVLERMDRDGLLKRYLGALEPEARKEFLVQAERKGYVTSEPAKKAEPKPCHPPEGPVLFFNDSTLPPCMREVIHTENARAAQAYYAAHGAYVERYVEQVMQAKSPLDIRQLGEPVAPFALAEPGVVYGSPDYERFRQGWTGWVQAVDGRVRAYQAVSHRMADLSGIQRPGSLWFKAEAELKAAIFKFGGEVVATQEGQAQGKVKKSVEARFEDLKVSLKPGGHGKPQVSVGLEREGVGISADSKGTVRTALPAGEGWGTYSEVNPQEGRFGYGLGRKVKLGGPLEAKVGVGLGMQGARPGRAQDVASREAGTLFGALPELDRHVPWEAIAPARRERMVRDGWTAQSWAEALQRVAK